MFKTKKQFKEEIARLKLDIEGLKVDKDIIDNQRKIAEGEMKTAKINHRLCVDRIKELEADIADRMRYTAELEDMVTELDEENDRLAEIVGEYQQGLARNTEKLKTAILENEDLNKKIQKYYEYEKSFRKQLKEKDAEISSLKAQNEIQRAVIEDAWNDNVIIEEEKTITFYTQEGEKTYPLIFKK